MVCHGQMIVVSCTKYGNPIKRLKGCSILFVGDAVIVFLKIFPLPGWQSCFLDDLIQCKIVW